MAVTPARVGKLRLNAGRLNYVAPTAPHTPTPPDGSRAGPLTLQWLCDGGQHYEVYFGTTTTPPLVGTTTQRAWVAPPLTIGTIYYWRVVALANALGAAAAGALWSFTAAVPAAPVYIAPPNHATNQPAVVTLQWSQPLTVPGDIVFDVYFGTSAGALPLVSRGQSALTFTTGTLADGVDYFWRIVARNNSGTASGPTWTFETRNPTKGLITIGGVDVRARVRVAGISVRDLLTDTPNTCTFTIEGAAPTVGQEVRIGLATLAGDDVLFGGYIDTVAAVYEGVPANRAWAITCQDYVYGMNRRKVRKRYGQQSATAIAQDLLTFAPSGYTGINIAAGLPIVNGGIDYTEEDLTACFARLAQRIGGYWYVDYARDVHVYLTEAVDAPTPITLAARVLLDQPAMHWTEDLTQIRTRVYVEGGGAQARSVVKPGDTVLPVTDGGWYSPSGGLVVSGPQRIRYTGKGTIGGPLAPAATPQAVVGALSGGPYSYVVTQITSGAESPMSAPSAPVTLAPVAAPTQPLTLTPVIGVVLAPATAPTLASVVTQVAPPTWTMNAAPALPETGKLPTPLQPGIPVPVDVGSGTAFQAQAYTAYHYACTYTNARGETTAGLSQYVSLSPPTKCNLEITIPAAPSGYSITGIKVFRNISSGRGFEFLGGMSAAGGTFKDTIAPSVTGAAPPSTDTTATPGTGGLTRGQQYQWRMVYVAANGETTAGPITTYTLPAGAPYYTAVQLTDVQPSPDGRVIARRIYRTANGPNFFLEATINDNTTTTYLSTKPDNQLGAGLANSNTTGTGKLARGGWYGWQVSFVTSAGETTPGVYSALALGATADTVDLSNIPTSTDARVTKRKIYRTANGGGAFRLEATLNDNTTTTYRSGAIADGALGANPPTTNTTGSGGLQPGAYWWTYRYVTASGESEVGPGNTLTLAAGSDTVQISTIAASPDARVTKRRIYRTSVNGGTYRFEAEINDNTTTTYTSSKRDDQLGADLVYGNTTSASGQIAVSAIAIGPAGTIARRLYRTKSGGAAYQLVVVISDNTTTTYQDNKADSALGESASTDELIQLTGIPASGAGAVLYEVRPGDDVNILVQCDDVPAQQALAALEGAPSQGIVEHFLQDRRVALSEATAMGNADLRLFARPLVTIDYATRDPKTRSGKTVHIDLPELSLAGDFTIQSVEISEIDQHPGLQPRYHVTCSSVRFSFEDALRRFQLETTPS